MGVPCITLADCIWLFSRHACAGTTTTCESLLMGVPCITLAGHCHAHNVSKSLLTAVGLCDGWLAHSRHEYVRLAQAQAAEPEALASLRGHLREDFLASTLCQAAPFLADLEERYRECFERWRSGGGRGASGVSGEGSREGRGGGRGASGGSGEGRGGGSGGSGGSSCTGEVELLEGTGAAAAGEHSGDDNS
jgi:hypothetical protein